MRKSSIDIGGAAVKIKIFEIIKSLREIAPVVWLLLLRPRKLVVFLRERCEDNLVFWPPLLVFLSLFGFSSALYGFAFSESVRSSVEQAVPFTKEATRTHSIGIDEDWPQIFTLGRVSLVSFWIDPLGFGVGINAFGQGSDNDRFALAEFQLGSAYAAVSDAPKGLLTKKTGILPLILIYAFVLGSSVWVSSRLFTSSNTWRQAICITVSFFSYAGITFVIIVYSMAIVLVQILHLSGWLFFGLWMGALLLLFGCLLRSIFLSIAEFYSLSGRRTALLIVTSYFPALIISPLVLAPTVLFFSATQELLSVIL